MGENIECIGLHFIIDWNYHWVKIKIKGGDCLIFRNETYHEFMRFDNNNNNTINMKQF